MVVVGIREAGDAAPPIHVRSDAVVRRCESIPHEHLPGIIFVVRAVDGAAGVREHASVGKREARGVQPGEGEGKIAAGTTRCRLQVQASAGSCRSIKLRDQRMTCVDKLNGEFLDAGHSDVRVAGRNIKGECPGAGSWIHRSRTAGCRDCVGR